jgi:hypothetical protein
MNLAKVMNLIKMITNENLGGHPQVLMFCFACKTQMVESLGVLLRIQMLYAIDEGISA